MQNENEQKKRLSQSHKNISDKIKYREYDKRMHAERIKSDANRSNNETIKTCMLRALKMKKIKKYS